MPGAAAQTPAPIALIEGTAGLDDRHGRNRGGQRRGAGAASIYEVQDADLAQGAVAGQPARGRRRGALKRADPKAQVETAGYSSYPVYAPAHARKVVGWRVRQSVTLRTADLAALPRTVAAAQQTLALGGIDFRLSRAARDEGRGAS
ncbi:MAG: SIMPL domain-containing protein [Comamonadaceae bacterium]|nr:SIMPL domain-containing protein [Comamonadaceae bacterium]